MRIYEIITVSPLQENCYLVGDAATRQVVCVDPGAEGERIVAAIRRHGLDVRAILITHCHADHVGAIAEVKAATGAPVYAPDGEQELYAQAVDFAAFFGFDITQPPEPDAWITAGAPLIAGPFRFDVLDVRGHSPASVAYMADGMVFPGDALFAGSIGYTDMAGADKPTLIDHIRRNLLSLPRATAVFPGHGPETAIGVEADTNPFLGGEGQGG